jgi:hypothetical protein
MKGLLPPPVVLWCGQSLRNQGLFKVLDPHLTIVKKESADGRLSAAG